MPSVEGLVAQTWFVGVDMARFAKLNSKLLIFLIFVVVDNSHFDVRPSFNNTHTQVTITASFANYLNVNLFLSFILFTSCVIQ